MNDVLKVFLSLSFSGSLLILLLFICRHFLKDKISRQWQYYIWLIVIARLLLPFAPETNLIGSIFQTVDLMIFQTDIISQQHEQDNLQDIEMIPFPNIKYKEQGKTSIQPASSQPIQDIITLLTNNIWLVWLVIALLLIMRKITVYQSFVQYVKAGQIPISDTRLLDRLVVIGEQAGIKKPIELCVNPLISSPLLIGFFRPCIILPSTNISEQDFQYAVIHEMIHFRRRDMFFKWLVQITICLHWFNPLVYLMGREINKACEFSCDEAIISKLNSCDIQKYGKSLLNAMATVGKYKETLASVPLSENKELLKERLSAIMNYKKKSKWAAVITCILTITIVFGYVVIGAYAASTATSSISEKQTIENKNVTEKSGLSLAKTFGKYGFIYNTKENAVYYNEQRVRQFVDGGAYYNGGGYWCDFFYNDKANKGNLYLHVVRGSRGSIKKIETMSNDMLVKLFGQNKALNSKPDQNNNSNIIEVYKDFSQYGLLYDKVNDNVLYNGKQVKAFVDGGSKYSKGGYWFNITFFNNNISSSLYLTSVRDNSGAIIGIKKMPQKMIKRYYGANGVLVSTKKDISPVNLNNDWQSIFNSFHLPKLPIQKNDPGSFYFYDKQNSYVLAVTRWKNATGTFNLCDILNNRLDSKVNIAYEITVNKGDFDFVHTTSQETSVIISESINSNSNSAYDHGVFKLNMSEGNNNFSFKCNNADVDIRIVIAN